MPAPWRMEGIPGGFFVLDTSGRRLAYVYTNTSLDAGVNSDALTEEKARRVAATIAKLANLLRRGADDAAQS